ncbi:MAG TPA: trypsin-like peptidase domain-containing protein [Spongiibacteraceae bacterium]|nr:trypsin-like peptidase domain-containing protein [Spongiibacteraceae bacterium]
MTEPLLLSTARINTLLNKQVLTNASGFFFERNQRLFLVTSRHVMVDRPSKHFPDSIEIELHTSADNMAASTGFLVPLYKNGKSLWRQGTDSVSEVDVAAIEIERGALPETVVYHAFTPAHLVDSGNHTVEIGTSMLIVGFPLGFHDTLHHLPVARHAVNASSFGLRFQGNGYFLTDGRTHRGTSGSPVVTRLKQSGTDTQTLPWALLGIHSSRVDIGSRDLKLDEALGLNCAWYADILLTLTEN